MRDHQADVPVAAMCRVLEVSPSGYYAWQQRGLSADAVRDVHLTALITATHARSFETYGAPRIRADLCAAGERVSQKRVARLMRTAGLAGVSRRRGTRTTQRGDAPTPSADLVQRQFTAAAPNQR